MLSAVLVSPQTWPTVPALAPSSREAQARTVTALSLPWLISAAVAGQLRDLILVASPQDRLEELADQVGCDLASREEERDAFASALDQVRCDRVLVLMAGYEPVGDLAGELERLSLQPQVEAHRLDVQARSLAQLWFPVLRTSIGVIAPRSLIREHSTFDELRGSQRRARRLSTAMRPLF